jgi:hypothetical protein
VRIDVTRSEDVNESFAEKKGKEMLGQHTISPTDHAEAEALQGLGNAPLGSIGREPRHQVATSVSATNASKIGDSPLSTSLPNVSTWNRMADLTSASAAS